MSAAPSPAAAADLNNFTTTASVTLHQRVLDVERKLQDFNKNDLGGISLASSSTSSLGLAANGGGGLTLKLSPPSNLGLFSSTKISPTSNLSLNFELPQQPSRPKTNNNHPTSHHNHHSRPNLGLLGHHYTASTPNISNSGHGGVNMMAAPLPKRPLPLFDGDGKPGSADSGAASGRKRRDLNQSHRSPHPHSPLYYHSHQKGGGVSPVTPTSSFCSSSSSSSSFSSTNQKLDFNNAADVERRLDEIMKLTGILRLRGKEYKSEPEDLQELSPLGNGTCGHVVKMRHRQTDCIMAVKKMRRSGNKEENKRIIMDLDVVMRSHDCPYIVRSFGCFITDSEVWICMEMMATCLDKLIKRIRSGIPERVIGQMAVSIVKALNYLKEKQGIIHRDVKPSNILLDWDGTVKLCDFGISGRLVDSKVRSKTTGCMGYMAPERISLKNADYDIRADVWSFGISLIELATGRSPYANCKGDFELLVQIVDGAPPLLTPDQGFSPLFCDFVVACLTKNFQERPKYVHLLKSDFIKFYETNPVDVGQWFKAVAAATTEGGREILLTSDPSDNVFEQSLIRL